LSILTECKKGNVPHAVAQVSQAEHVATELLREQVAAGKAVVFASKRDITPVGIGEGLRKKLASIVGTSSADADLRPVLRKAQTARDAGATVIIDGSTAGDVGAIHATLLEEINIPIGICQSIRVAAQVRRQGRDFVTVEPEQFLAQIEESAASGCEFLTGPFSITLDLLEMLRSSSRIMPCCNKTNSLMIAWMRRNRRENPYAEQFDRVLRAARENDKVLCFVLAFRPGCIADAADELQMEEIQQTARLVRQANEAGVQVEVMSGGHVPLDRIQMLFQFHKQQMPAPIVSFGPLVTDTAIGYDHAIAAVGQSQALLYGADMISTITAAEHLALPSEDEVKEACIIARYVCHSVDVARGLDLQQDREISKARERLDWTFQLAHSADPQRAESIRWRSPDVAECTLCGDLCAYRTMRAANGLGGKDTKIGHRMRMPETS